MKKQLLILMTLAILPFGSVFGATELTISNDDKAHIASTAYVKGAYNDTVNTINNQRAVVYTTWDNDSATNQVSLATATTASGSITPTQAPANVPSGGNIP